MIIVFNISYENWRKICQAYKKEKINRRKSYLQWYTLTNGFLNTISEKDFFDKYIKTGYLFFDENVTMILSHYLQKSDGTYRDAQLINPTLYILLQTICYQFYLCCGYSEKNIITYYSGCFDKLDIHYSNYYDLFYKDINYYSEIFDYYLKIDIKDYFRSINIDTLFEDINEFSKEDKYPENEILIYKELFKLIGKDKFPILENSIGLSYLATNVYLRKIDENFFDYLDTNQNLTNFQMIRYVDDLYVFFNTNTCNVDKISLNLLNKYNTFLDRKSLSINMLKVNYNYTTNISESLKQSFYEEIVNGESFNIHVSSETYLVDFIEKLKSCKLEKGIILKSDFDSIIDEVFSRQEYALSAKELFTLCVFDNKPIV